MYGVTEMYMALRSAERFGMPPVEWLSQPLAVKQQLLDYEQVRRSEESRALALTIAGVELK